MSKTPTHEQINRAIAEWCGIKIGHWHCPSCGPVEPSHVTYSERHDLDSCLRFVHWVEIPDYSRDLNACHGAEGKLTAYQYVIFLRLLFSSAYNSGRCKTNDEAERERVSATAAQRAKALARVVAPELFQ